MNFYVFPSHKLRTCAGIQHERRSKGRAFQLWEYVSVSIFSQAIDGNHVVGISTRATNQQNKYLLLRVARVRMLGNHEQINRIMNTSFVYLFPIHMLETKPEKENKSILLRTRAKYEHGHVQKLHHLDDITRNAWRIFDCSDSRENRSTSTDIHHIHVQSAKKMNAATEHCRLDSNKCFFYAFIKFSIYVLHFCKFFCFSFSHFIYSAPLKFFLHSVRKV